MAKLTDDQIRDAVWRMIAALPCEGAATEPEHRLDQGIPVEGVQRGDAPVLRMKGRHDRPHRFGRAQ